MQVLCFPPVSGPPGLTATAKWEALAAADTPVEAPDAERIRAGRARVGMDAPAAELAALLPDE